jgi:signal transduction histidine kinase
MQAVHPDDVPTVAARVEEAVASCAPYQVEFRLKRASDGAYRWFLGRGVPVLNESGAVVRWYGTSTDINDQKRIQEMLRDSDRRKDEFLATLAHELRNPLAPIRNALEIMRLAGSDPEALQRSRALIERQVHQLVRLIDDLLDISRITRGKVKLRKEQVEAAVIVQSAVETAQPFIEHAGHTLKVELPREPLLLEADPTRLAQVLVNLLNNAAKYTDPGGRITLTVVRRQERVVFRVRDTGIGIAPSMLTRIFEMFTQMGRAEDRSQGGLGIGLALVRGLVGLHGGTVEAHSEGPGKGSEFVVSLPLGNN